MHIDGGYQKEEDGLLDLEILEQVNVIGVEEGGNAQDDPGPRDWGYMDRLRKGGLPLVGQGGCEVHAKTPLRGAGKKEERLRASRQRLFVCRELLKPVAYLLGRQRSSLNATSMPTYLKSFPIFPTLRRHCHG